MLPMLPNNHGTQQVGQRKESIDRSILPHLYPRCASIFPSSRGHGGTWVYLGVKLAISPLST